MSNRLGGKQGTAYVGTNANQPPNLTYNNRPPNAYDINYSVGDFWIDSSAPDLDKLWVLVSLEGTSSSKGQLGHWVMVGSGSGTGLQTLTGDSGGAIPGDGADNINIVGGTHITVNGTFATNTLTIDSDGEFADQFTTDAGVATPALGNINVLGGSNMNTAATAPDTVTVNLNDNIIWPASGPGTGYIDIDGQVMMHTFDASGGNTNIFMGPAAGNFTMAAGAINNSAIGTVALANLTTGNNNFAGGTNTLVFLADGIRNVAVGSSALQNAVSTQDCIAIGASALTGATVETKSIAIGSQASAQGNGFTIAIGTNALLLNNAPVGQNVAIGDNVMVSNIDSEQTVAIGNGSVLGSLTTSNLNTSVGYASLPSLINGQNNHVFGAGSGGNYVGAESSNILISNEGVAGESNAIRIGGFNQVLGGPIAIGADALPVTSDTNIAIGAESLNLLNGITGVDNLALGIRSLRNLDQGFHNISIGYESSLNYVGSEHSNIVIGNEGVLGDTNTIRIGTDGNATGEQDSVFIAGIYNTTAGLTAPRNVIIGSDGQLGTGGSDGTPNAFMAIQTVANATAIPAGGAPYLLGNATAFTEIYDVGNNFYPGDGAGTPASFTAPSDGKYYLSFRVNVFRTTAMETLRLLQASLKIITTARTYQNISTVSYISGSTSSISIASHELGIVADMSAGDTATFSVSIDLSFVWGLAGNGAGGEAQTWIMGYQVSS